MHITKISRRIGVRSTSRSLSTSRFVRVAALSIGLGFVALRSPAARAEDPPPSGGDVQAKIEEKMKEILRLMRENGKAILDASQGGTQKPKGVDVKPPDGQPGSTPPPQGTPPPEGAGGTSGMGSEPGSGPGTGGEIKRRMEEILEQSNKTGAAIPKELEELIRMIPRKKQGPPSDGSDPGEPKTRKPGEANKPKDGDPTTGDKKEPKDGERDPKPHDGDKPPPDGEKAGPKDDDTPPWALELPPESRRSALNADPEKAPAQYRDLLIRYQKWLRERADKAR